MNPEFYIIVGKSRSGPHDLVAIVRKIRNGAVTAHTLLELEGTAESKPAEMWPQLSEFFTESKDERNVTPERKPSEDNGLGKTLSNGMKFLQRNQNAAVYSGLFVLMSILAAAAINYVLPPFTHVFAFMALFIGGHYILSCYLFSLLRMARGQPVDAGYLQGKIGPATRSLLLSSLFICIPCMLGLALLINPLPKPLILAGLFIFAVPGLFILSLYSFTPLLIMDKGYDFWEAMEASRKNILKSGLEKAGLIYALFVINFLAGLLLMIPLAITLPITMGALCEIYDDLFG